MADNSSNDEAAQRPTTGSSRPDWLTNRVIGGLVLAVVLLLFIAFNGEHTEISFVAFKAETALWVALALAGGIGFVAGFLFGRKHYKAQG